MSKIKVGDVFTTNQGCKCEVVEYVSARRVKIKFLDEYSYECFVEAGHLRKGSVKNPYHPNVLGVGYTGVGEHEAYFEGRDTKEYKTWRNMLERCYSKRFQESSPTYKGCYVHKDWHNFQEFSGWYKKQGKRCGLHLDKDLLKRGNKEYSKEWCRMIPQEVNKLLTDRGALRGDLPLGVNVHGKGFRARLNVFGKLKRLGTYTTPTEAFLIYKKAKEVQIKEVANLYKDVICQDVYKALMSWEVECDIYDKMKEGLV